ncbi:hypothetical protein HanXRQr2_Chr12g0557781 [Helianthus annuus]|uniref:Uncharacterized protein n=1 Tax=Helianthus annuus TaxID=4232 RepID=A0A9K3MXY7_HELAN|nr:hypothetical protein HanXRQr2_Chr12g0557781 [Helianthus annuus]KAJ0864035.1 hypothetical protein HanPSC8_Chr12g0537021 [Helianthus annuus]
MRPFARLFGTFTIGITGSTHITTIFYTCTPTIPSFFCTLRGSPLGINFSLFLLRRGGRVHILLAGGTYIKSHKEF